ncbi:hypothetical protein PVK06_044274 [Gossypium arboreum]|uniref:Uncharacterized protein n=1 Tax=Gossypium arboreum TaxID=29729 RepID=A0ABR0MSH5_GOSAR|nr:hypothetical protein PVK06_044274 [Gossypium arboreum]
MMNFLRPEDFKNINFDPKWSVFDYLLEIMRVDQENLKERNFKIKNFEKKSHGFGCGSFMQEKSFNNNDRLRRKCQFMEENIKNKRPIVSYPPPLLSESLKQQDRIIFCSKRQFNNQYGGSIPIDE